MGAALCVYIVVHQSGLRPKLSRQDMEASGVQLTAAEPRKEVVMQVYGISPSTVRAIPTFASIPCALGGRDPSTPSLADILADPITRAIMRADRVSAIDLVALCRTVRTRLLAA
jgi:hypothetical protein